MLEVCWTFAGSRKHPINVIVAVATVANCKQPKPGNRLTEMCKAIILLNRNIFINFFVFKLTD